MKVNQLRKVMPQSLLVLSLTLLAAAGDSARAAEANYDEAKVPAYTLPDPLVMGNGQPVTDAKMWQKQRRPELLTLFETEMYGRSPGKPKGLKVEVRSVDRAALGGKATRKEVAVYFTGKKDGPKLDLLLYVPNGVKRPVPAFLGMNFGGNHSIHADPAIPLSQQWMREAKDGTVTNNRATEQSRGKEASRWQLETVLARGYALATVYYGDLEPDFVEGWKLGVRSGFRPAPAQPPLPPLSLDRKPKGAPPEAGPDEWGAIGAWAWGLSRALDALEKDKDINAKQVAVLGHSRLGKTALWAGATDERFAIVISNDSGCGGASLSRRTFGETVERINTAFPHWFCGNFKKFNGRENERSVDQHELIALMAPRPVYVASAEKDLWADPRGEFLSAKHAEPVYRLFGKAGLGVTEMPGLNQPVGDTIGYHIRTGKHDVTDYDWEQYLNFADRHFGRGRK